MSTRFIDTSPITPTAGLPFRGVSLDHLKKGDEDATNAFCKNMIGPTYFDPLKTYVISGCINSTPAGPAFTISSGFIFHSGFLFIVDATTFTPAMGETAVCVLNNIYEPLADPTTFTDGSNHSVHVIRKIKIQSGVSGSGLVDFNNLEYVGYMQKHIVGEPGEPGFSGSWNNFVGDKLTFRLDIQNNLLHFSGTTFNTSYTGSYELIFTLPSNYKVKESKGSIISGKTGASSVAQFEIVINSSPSNQVLVRPAYSPFTTTGCILYFSGLSVFLG